MRREGYASIKVAIESDFPEMAEPQTKALAIQVYNEISKRDLLDLFLGRRKLSFISPPPATKFLRLLRVVYRGKVYEKIIEPAYWDFLIEYEEALKKEDFQLASYLRWQFIGFQTCSVFWVFWNRVKRLADAIEKMTKHREE